MPNETAKKALANTITAQPGKPRKIAANRLINPHALPWIITALVLSLIPHLHRLPLWLTLFCFIIVGFKLLCIRYPKITPGRLLIAALTLLSVGAVMLHYTKLFGRDAGVSLLIIMLFLKLLETRNHRDGMVIITLSYFLVITHFLYTQSIPTAFYMLGIVVLITLALITLNQATDSIRIKDKLRISVAMTVLALPIMVVFFILFPRIPGPLWGLPDDSHSGRSGLSDTMSPGELSQLALSDEVAFRVKFAGTPPLPENLYWRTLIFWDYDGRTWRESASLLNYPMTVEEDVVDPNENFVGLGPAIEYTVTLEPHNRRWLFALDMPEVDYEAKAVGLYQITMDRHKLLRSSKSINNLVQYSLASYPSYQLSKVLPDQDRIRALKLPADGNPRSRELAQQWRETISSPAQRVAAALAYFNESFSYTLRPARVGQHFVDGFLFETKEGFCEHFSGSFVFLMRAAGIPARVVVGYQGGEINPIGDYMLIRQADAHAWAEVWLENQGWVRVDPTMAVSPARIELGLDAAIPARDNPRFLLRRNNPVLAQLNLIWDSINNRWNEWILGYGPEMQKTFLQRFGLGNAAAHKLVFILTACLAVLMLAIALFSFRQQRKKLDPIQLLYAKLCKRLAKKGFPRQPYEGPEGYHRRLTKDAPALGQQLKSIFQQYSRLRYGPAYTAAEFDNFKTQIKAIQLSPSPD